MADALEDKRSTVRADEESGQSIRADVEGRIPLAWRPGVLAGGRLHLLRLVGRGASSLVFEARDDLRKQSVALKLLTYADPTSIYNLKNEFRSLADLRHPNLARLYELAHHDDHWFITMEFVDGEPFDAWVRPNAVLDERRLRSALAQLVGAVKAVHEAGKLHRDLKPSNVLVTPEGRLVVLDFGLSIDHTTGAGGTVSGEVGGTPAYMAPEHARGGPAAPSGDAYAVGVMMYEALTGRLPRSGLSVQALQSPGSWTPDWPDVDLPADLRELCSALIAPDPDERPTLQGVLTRVVAAAAADVAHASVPLPEADTTREVIVGRSRELGVLSAAFDGCLTERASLVAVRGTGGIGKTALCEEFLRQLEIRADTLVLRARCYEHESLPFKAIDPLIDALGRYVRRLPSEEAGTVLPRDVYALSHIFPSLRRVDVIARMPARPMADPQELHGRAVGALAEWLTRLRDRGPVVVLIDDLQWACDDSLLALHQLLVARTAPSILFLIAYRDDGSRGSVALQPLLDAARDNPSWKLSDLPLTRLSSDASEALAAQITQGHDVIPIALSAIAREGAGNPLLIRELARFAVQGGALTRTITLASVLATRLAELSSAARRLIEMLALVGEPLPLHIALESSRAVMVDVDLLRAARLVRSEGERSDPDEVRIDCFHDRMREELLTRVGSDLARAHFAELARVLSRQPELDHRLLGRCLEHAGDSDGAAYHSLQAARQADRKMAFEQAARLYKKSLELGRYDAPTRHLVTLARGVAQENAGAGTSAAMTFEHAAAGAAGLDAIELRRRAAEQWLATGHTAKGIKLLRDVYGQLDLDLPRAAPSTLIHLVWKQLRHVIIPIDARAPASSCVSERDEVRMRAARTAVNGLVGCRLLLSACAAADYLELAWKVGRESDRIRALGYHIYMLSLVVPRAQRVAEFMHQMDDLAVRHGGAEMLGFAALIMGIHALFAGEPSARAHFKRARPLLAECRGLQWEVDVLNFHDQYSAFHCGDFAYIARTTPGLIQQAEHCGRLYAAAMLTGYGGIVAWIAPDDVAGYRRRLSEIRSQWMDLDDAEGGWPDLLSVLGEAMCHLYAGTPVEGMKVLKQQRSRFGRTILSVGVGGQPPYSLYWDLCAASALSIARRSGDEAQRRELAVSLRRNLKLDRRGKSGQVREQPSAVRAALALDGGQVDDAVMWLRLTVASHQASGMRMHAAAAQRRLGQLSGEADAGLRGEAESAMRAEGITNVEAMTEFLCPGCRPSSE